MKKTMVMILLIVFTSHLHTQVVNNINNKQKEINMKLGTGVFSMLIPFSLVPVMSEIGFVETDKLAHFGATTAISGLGTYYGYKLTKSNLGAFGIGFSLGMLATFGKEYIWDKKMGKGTFNQKDIVAGTFGSFTGAFVVIIPISFNNTDNTKRFNQRK